MAATAQRWMCSLLLVALAGSPVRRSAEAQLPSPLDQSYVGNAINKITKTAEQLDAQLLKDLKDSLDMNVGYQMRRIGLPQQLHQLGFSADFAGVPKNSSKCYGDLGCLEVSEEWYGLSRPINLLPEDREDINTRFILTTRESLDSPEFLNISEPSSIRDSKYNGSRPTALIIHGFIDTGFVPWVKEMTEKMLVFHDVNVVAVDWGGGSASIYPQSAANIRLVGIEAAKLILHLMDHYETAAADFHVIGHSLGAHAAGYIGQHIQETTGRKLGRISGLDPADPGFTSMPTFVRLDPSDAEFVDVIHTDTSSTFMFGYGTQEPCGHVDFYPNGGNQQPGCTLLDIPVGFDSMVEPDKTADIVGRHLVACSHTRAIELYIESIDLGGSNDGRNNESTTTLPETGCQLIGFECPSYEHFKLGMCFSCGPNMESCARLGYRSIDYKTIAKRLNRVYVKFFLDTAKSKPYCQFHYVLDLALAKPPAAERWVQGRLKVNLHGAEDEVVDYNLTPTSSVRLYHGGTKSFLISFHQRLGPVGLVNLYWLYDHHLDPLDLLKVCLILCSDRLYLSNVSIKSISMAELPSPSGAALFKEQQSTICGDVKEGFTRISSDDWRIFYKSC